MEGLPVRQWRKQATLITNTASRDPASGARARNPSWRELPMPVGSELYSPMSAALLRAARLGQMSRPAPSVGDDEKDTGDDEDEVVAAAATVAAPEADGDAGFVAPRWNAVPRDAELPEPEFLAPRRKGLPSLHGEVAQVDGAAVPMRKTKVRKTDGEGHTAVWDVLVPEGAVVEGEVLDGDEVLTEAVAPGTVVEGVGVANADGIVIAAETLAPTPQRKKYHPPKLKRKGRGPGRGRWKFQRLGAGAAAAGAVPVVDGAPASLAATTTPTSLKPADAAVSGNAPGDVAMREGSVVVEGEEASDDDDDADDDAEDADREEGELSQTPDPEARPAVLVPVTTDVEMADVPPRDLSSSPDLPLAAAAAAHAPAVNVVTATEASVPSPEILRATDGHEMAGIQQMDDEPQKLAVKTVAEQVEQQESVVEAPSAASPVEQSTADASLLPPSLLESTSDVVAEPASELPSPSISTHEATSLPTQPAPPADLTMTTAASIDKGSAVPAVPPDEASLLPPTTPSLPPKSTSSSPPPATTMPSVPPAASSAQPAPTTSPPTEAPEPATASPVGIAPDMPDAVDVSAPLPAPENGQPLTTEVEAAVAAPTGPTNGMVKFADGDEDLLGTLEQSLEAETK